MWDDMDINYIYHKLIFTVNKINVSESKNFNK